MIKMNDIYYKVDNNLLKGVFLNATPIEQKEMIAEELKKYLTRKILISGTKIPSNNDFTVNELLDILADIIPEKAHGKTLSHFTQYIIGVVGGLQEHYITFSTENEPALIETPITEFDEQGRWDTLKIHKQTSILTVCKVAYDTFQNDFMVKKDAVKKLGTMSSNN